MDLLLNELTALRRRVGDLEGAEETLRRSETEARQSAQENALLARVGQIISSSVNLEDALKNRSRPTPFQGRSETCSTRWDGARNSVRRKVFKP
jgi:hypothetical protein